MAHETEAACLLRTGALYPLRLGLQPPGGGSIFLGVKPGALSLYFDDEPIYHFDLDGRWQRAFVNGVHYLKGLDAIVQAVDRVREGDGLVLRRRLLTFAEAVDLDAKVRATAIRLIDGLNDGWEAAPPPGDARPLTPDEARTLLDRVARWDAAAWFAHRERYLRTYGPLPFLPPEASQPVILQATLGHARGPGFGGEPAREFYARTPAEFADHARDVATLLGRRVLQCRQVFLAGADSLRQPFETILAQLDAAAAVFPPSDGRPRPRARDVDVLDDRPTLDGVQAMLHEFDGPPFAPDAWDALRSRGLRRLILGVESGSARVRALYGRAWNDDDLAAWVASCPIDLGVVVVVGAGGREGGADHVAATVETVAALPVRAGTLVSLVDSDELDVRPAAERGFVPLNPAEMATQRAELKAGLADALAGRKVKVTTYATSKRWQ